jgi:DNA repair exonuclease SbcCD nuclease subunit
VKIAHLSDTHLGHVGQGIQEMVDDPFHPGVLISQRAADILLAFRRAIDLIIEAVCPDVVIHSGDLFDSARPQVSVIDIAMRQARRLTKAGIPLLVVEGNHSYPRERAMGHVVQLLEHLPDVRVVCEGYEVVQFAGVSLALHALPHGPLFSGELPQLDRRVAHCPNVLVAHGVVDNSPFYRTGRPAPPIYLGPFEDWYDYIALGHYHRFCQPNLHRRSFYAGAPTMVTWGDFAAGQGFSLNVVELDSAEPRIERLQVPGRVMHAYGLDDASSLSASDILDHLGNQVAASPPSDAYCRVQVHNIEPRARQELDVRAIEDLFATAAGLERILRPRDPPWARTQAAQEAGGSPLARYARLVADATEGEEEEFRSDVLTLGTSFLERAADELVREDG